VSKPPRAPKPAPRPSHAPRRRAGARHAIDLIVEVLRSGESQRIVARGVSMAPAIANGTPLDVVPLTRAPQLGDVLVVLQRAPAAASTLLVHRVVGVRADGCVLLRGDACANADGWITPGEILGRALVNGAPPPPAARRVVRPLWVRLLARLRRALRR
jgi:hypothetical protein